MKTFASFRSKLLALTLALMASVSSLAYDFQVNGLNYNITSSVDPYTVEVTKNISDNGNNYEGYTSITIPKSVLHNGVKYQVTGIGKEAFLYTSVSEFTIPETVKYIAESAFGGSFELTSIEIPNSVTDIGSAAFTCSHKLTSVTLGKGGTTIGSLAFMGCRELQSINIPESVTAISALAFYDCPKITDVKLNNGLVEIKDQAFSYTNITSIELPQSVTILGLNPFSYIPSLTKMSVKKGHPLFNSDPNSNAIIETATNTLVAGCRYSIIPNTITVVGKAAFMGCKGRTELSLPNSVKTINDSAYFDCIDLKSIDIPNSVTTIGSEAFSWCTSATSLTIGENVNSIGGRAFWGCEKIKTVTCNAIVVPNLGEDVFPCWLGGNINDATLYVPAKSVEAYKTAAQWKEFGQILPIEQTLEDLFPTLWGLQRTACSEYTDCEENVTYLMQANEIKEINGKQYLKYGGVFLREEDNKVLIYSFPYEKDLVLYDWTLEIGDTLQNLGIDPYSFPELEYAAVVDYIAYEDYDVETGDFIIKKEPLGNKRVKDISTIRLLDGNEYKAWLFGYDWERGDYYVEGIGNFSKYGGDYVDLAHPFAFPTCYYGERLVCVSRNGKLLYCMDDAEMERLGAECLCDYNSGPKKDNAKNGKIGGRPTPTQWNMLEVETKEMNGTSTVLRAETFSYTLENDSIVANGKTFYYLARQSTKDTAITKSVVGALHFSEDDGNRVYFLRDGVEYVLYDFTAELGDTIEIFAGINNYPQYTTYTHVVTGKDTIENGACRMMLEVVFPEQNASVANAQKIWLAGLGSIDGIVHNAAAQTGRARSSETQASVMLCAWRDDDCLYTTDHPDYDDYGCVYNQEPTSVGEIQTPTATTYKLLRNSQLLIIHEGKTYNVLGVVVK